MTPDLELALSLADAADELTLGHFRSASLAVRTKADATPVSEVDEAVERLLRSRLPAADAIVGEEFGASSASDAKRKWILDPIDATKNYIRGIPVFGTLIALAVDDVLEVGVVSAPALQRRWWAARGQGAFCNGAPIRVSSIAKLEESQLGYDGIADFDKAGLSDKFLALARSCYRTRAFGDFWIHMLVAEGAMDAAVEPEIAPWDVAAIQLIVEEAGGRFTTLRGEATWAGGSAVSTNGLVHEAVLEALA